jgi:flavin reductase
MRAIDTYQLRTCLGCFGTGVTVVTVDSENGNRGLTVNAFTSVSLDPPLVLISINKRARSHDALAGRSFAVNVLSSDQEQLARHFAGDHQDIELPWEQGQVAPRLGGVIASMECRPWGSYEGGDHTLYLGEVVALGYRHGDALGYFRSRFVRLSEPALVASPHTHDPFELPYDAYE